MNPFGFCLGDADEISPQEKPCFRLARPTCAESGVIFSGNEETAWQLHSTPGERALAFCSGQERHEGRPGFARSERGGEGRDLLLHPRL
jgi:hypothetical protein